MQQGRPGASEKAKEDKKNSRLIPAGATGHIKNWSIQERAAILISPEAYKELIFFIMNQAGPGEGYSEFIRSAIRNRLKGEQEHG